MQKVASVETKRKERGHKQDDGPVDSSIARNFKWKTIESHINSQQLPKN